MQAHKKEEVYSVYLKIFVSYLQIVTLISSFNLNWPDLVKELLDFQESAGSVTRQIYSYDCFLDEFISEDVDTYFKRLLIQFSIPIWFVILPLLVWSIVAWRRRDMNYIYTHFISTMIIMLFIAHPDVSTMMFSAFVCIEIESGETWLLEDLDIQCWQGHHNEYAYGIALPGLIIWTIGIPIFALLILVRYKRSLNEIYVRRKIGFMFMGYRRKFYFWEIIITYRKLSIAFISIFLYQFGVEFQALAVMIVVMVSFYLQNRYQPFDQKELNHLEMRSIVVSGITMYSGLFFLTDALGEEAKIIFFLIIVIANVQFLVIWIQGLVRGILLKVARIKPRLARRWCRCVEYMFQEANLTLETALPVPLNALRSLDAQEEEVMEEPGAYVKYVFKRKYESILAGATSTTLDLTNYD